MGALPVHPGRKERTILTLRQQENKLEMDALLKHHEKKANDLTRSNITWKMIMLTIYKHYFMNKKVHTKFALLKY